MKNWLTRVDLPSSGVGPRGSESDGGADIAVAYRGQLDTKALIGYRVKREAGNLGSVDELGSAR